MIKKFKNALLCDEPLYARNLFPLTIYDEQEIFLNIKEICELKRAYAYSNKQYKEMRQNPPIFHKNLDVMLGKIKTKYSDEILYLIVENNDWPAFLEKLEIRDI